MGMTLPWELKKQNRPCTERRKRAHMGTGIQTCLCVFWVRRALVEPVVASGLRGDGWIIELDEPRAWRGEGSNAFMFSFWV